MPKDTKSYAPRIPPSTWEQHQCRITALFVEDKKTLSKVADIMKEYGLHASESQYERQLRSWGIKKNSTRGEWQVVKRIVDQRRRQGKDSTVLIRGIEQPNGRVDRELARSHYPGHTGFEYSLPGYIRVLTPPAVAVEIDGPPGSTASRFLIREAHVSISFCCPYCAESCVGAATISVHRKAGVTTVVRGLGVFSDSHSSCAEAFPRWKNGFPFVFERRLLEQQNVENNHAPLSEGRSHNHSSSSGELMAIPSLEAVGITPEEWVTRGWNVFFGAWGVG